MVSRWLLSLSKGDSTASLGNLYYHNVQQLDKQRPEGRNKVMLKAKIPLGLLVAPSQTGISLVEKNK